MPPWNSDFAVEFFLFIPRALKSARGACLGIDGHPEAVRVAWLSDLIIAVHTEVTADIANAASSKTMATAAGSVDQRLSGCNLQVCVAA